MTSRCLSAQAISLRAGACQKQAIGPPRFANISLGARLIKMIIISQSVTAISLQSARSGFILFSTRRRHAVAYGFRPATVAVYRTHAGADYRHAGALHYRRLYDIGFRAGPWLSPRPECRLAWVAAGLLYFQGSDIWRRLFCDILSLFPI